MLRKGELSAAFGVYFEDAERCLAASAYWCLLHVTVCLPDVCAALQSRDGEASGLRYEKWCNRYFGQPCLLGSERYQIRCKVLHQGRARTTKQPRYSNFAFGQPDASGRVDHLRVDGRTLHVDVGELYRETRRAIRQWILSLESRPISAPAMNAAKNLSLLVRVSKQQVPVLVRGGTPSYSIISKTN
jgi:hypothetical protein